MIHFLYVPFTGLGIRDGYRGDAWLRNRLRVFHQFVLPSILNQSKKEFVLWFSWRPHEEKNPIVREFKEQLDGIRGLSYVFTFGGLCFYDDKLEDKEAREKLYRNLSKTLPQLKPVVGNEKWVYMTIQPSDDLYSSEAVKLIQEQEPKERKAVGWRKGYVMDYSTKDVAFYDPDTIPPFTTFIFPTEMFLDPQKHFDYIGPYESHEYVKDHFDYQELPGRHFCVGTHGANISTTWNHPYKGVTLEGDKKMKTWLGFGVWESDPVLMPKTLTLKLRIFLNRLPKPIHDLIRNIYRYVRK